MISRTGRVHGVVTMVLALAGAPLSLLGQLRDGDALAPVVANLPLSTRVVIVSSTPSAVLAQMKTPWRRMSALTMGMGADTLKGWALLSRQLGYEPGEAFDALTSGGLAVVVAGPAAGKVEAKLQHEPAITVDARWAVLTVVKAEVAARVREKLEAVPHKVIGGVPVLSVEDGRFAIVCRGLSGAAGSDEVIALTPTEDGAFLASIVASVDAARPRAGAPAAPGEGVIGSSPAFAAARLKKCDVLVLAAEMPDAPAGNDAAPGAAEEAPVSWERGSVIACTLAPAAWSFDIEPTGTAAPSGPSGTVAPGASALFDAWSPRAAVMFVSGGGAELQGVIEELHPGVFPDGDRLEGTLVYVGAPAATPKDQEAAGRVAAWCGVRVSGGDGPHAAALDRFGGRLVRLAESGEWIQELVATLEPGAVKKNDARPDPSDPGVYAAAGPSALRTASVRIQAPMQFIPGGRPSTPIAGTVAWFQSAAAGAAEREPRWMVWGVEPTQDVDAVAARHVEASSFLAGAPAVEKQWVVRSVVRPHRIVEALPAPMALAAGMAGVGAVKELRFEAWEEPVEGRVRERARLVIEWSGATGAAPVKR